MCRCTTHTQQLHTMSSIWLPLCSVRSHRPPAMSESLCIPDSGNLQCCSDSVTTCRILLFGAHATLCKSSFGCLSWSRSRTAFSSSEFGVTRTPSICGSHRVPECHLPLSLLLDNIIWLSAHQRACLDLEGPNDGISLAPAGP